MPTSHPIFERLRAVPGARPLVTSHRGDSSNHPENTMAAFRAAVDLGIAMHEFDVRELACGTLVCVHDATFDRTTDSARVLGPGAPVAQLSFGEVAQLDAGGGERVPKLADALALMAPDSVPLIEHKAGCAERYVEELRASGHERTVVLQSFDWRFLRAVRQLAPDIALGALGPNPVYPAPNDEALDVAQQCGAQLLHWRAAELDRAAVQRMHRRGLFVCTYTTDDVLGWLGGAALGIDAMCTNRPGAMQRCQAQP